MEKKRFYEEAQMKVVLLSGKMQLLAESGADSSSTTPTSMSAGALRMDYTDGGNPLQ